MYMWGIVIFLVVLHQCTSYNFETADQISMTLGVDIRFRSRSCLTVQSYSPGSANSTRTGESRLALPRISS